MVENEAKKVYVVTQYTRDGSIGTNDENLEELLGIFSTEEKAITFVEKHGLKLDKKEEIMMVEVWREHFEIGGHSDDDYSIVYIEELCLDEERLPVCMSRWGRYE